MSRLGGVSRWLPPLALMALIFYLSSRPDLTTGLGLVDLIGRKLLHAGEYALLCALWWRALRPQLSPRAALIGAVSIAVAYAVTDEVHQTFVPTRNGTPVDVAIDAAGAGVAALVITRRGRPHPAGERAKASGARAPRSSEEAAPSASGHGAHPAARAPR
jgi:hypothetical protein